MAELANEMGLVGTGDRRQLPRHRARPHRDGRRLPRHPPPVRHRAPREPHRARDGPRAGVQGDDEIIAAGLEQGTCGYHAIGTCAMGPDDDDVVDPRLRVRGVTGLRVVDASVLPTMVAGNLNGPVSALAWRAADLITTTA
ncbi:GMC oxidoreductase [Actinomadura madurae]|uniref:GMC oxidoreductase n=1 Tax=Actinomadura madurae TaxID=1993 RepID=UPI0020D23C49|nr:GMC oxidoreductase [Actinomadura madurae]MCP9972420.1 GMC oxidoreductase [Actinomadura madurae]MCQ0003509.1 GMC oxidoreductase [Actinomadura madurae]